MADLRNNFGKFRISITLYNIITLFFAAEKAAFFCPKKKFNVKTP